MYIDVTMLNEGKPDSGSQDKGAGREATTYYIVYSCIMYSQR